MLLTDPKNKDPRAYLPTFIDDSLKAGRLLDRDEYLINRGKHAAGPQKATRTPFSKDDDVELIAWVLSHQDKKRSGNELYKLLADKVC